MATLYQLHSSIDTLEHTISDIAAHWQAGDRIVLLGATAAFSDWLYPYLCDNGMVANDALANEVVYALADDIAALTSEPLDTQHLTVLSDYEWVELTCQPKFDKVVTIAS